MIMWKTMFVAFAMAVTSLGSVAQAESEGRYKCNAGSPALSDQEITKMLTNQGYDVRRLKPEHGCVEAYAISPNGSRVELIIDPTDGKILGMED